MEYIMVVTTMKSRTEAQKIADALLDKKLAGCIQIVGPIRSSYLWKGKKVKSIEWLTLIKSKKRHYAKIEKTIKRNHSYAVPEILCFDVVAGNRDYLKWLDEAI